MAVPLLLWMWLLAAGTQGELRPRNAESGSLRSCRSPFCGLEPSQKIEAMFSLGLLSCLKPWLS